VRITARCSLARRSIRKRREAMALHYIDNLDARLEMFAPVI